jgi:hypothetical protein
VAAFTVQSEHDFHYGDIQNTGFKSYSKTFFMKMPTGDDRKFATYWQYYVTQ